MWWSCQSPVAHSCGLLNHLNSFHRGMFKLKATLVQIHCSNHSVILNAWATQYTCSLNGVCCPHWLVQWGCHYSLMHVPVHSPWLPGYISVSYINNGWLLPRRPRIFSYTVGKRTWMGFHFIHLRFAIVEKRGASAHV